MAEALFPPQFFAALERLARKPAAEGIGRARQPRAGTGVLGYEHRRYAPGDAPRSVDWRASARSGQVQVRRREREAGGELCLVLDRSASLCPRRPRRDLDQRRLALALGWLHLEAGGVLQLSAGAAAPRAFSGRERRVLLQKALEELVPPQGGAGIEFTRRCQRTVVLTDPWSELPPRLPDNTRWVSLVLPEEQRPPEGGLELVEVETGHRMEVDLHAADFQGRWAQWLERRRAQCRERGALAVELRCGAAADPATAILEAAQEAGLV